MGRTYLCSLWLKQLWNTSSHRASRKGPLDHHPPGANHTPIMTRGKEVNSNTGRSSVKYLNKSFQ